MEIQLPLILFTTFLAWSAGILIALGVLSLKCNVSKAQLPGLVAGLVTLAIGGVAVLFHLAQPLHIFNGFGHLSSGITQELIAIVVLFVAMVVYFITVRRSDDGNPPAVMAIAIIVLSLVLDVVMAHSYMMVSRPFWNSALQVLSIIGGSCVMGPATMAIICSAVKTEGAEKLNGLLVLGGALVNAVTTLAYLAYSAAAEGSYLTLGYYFDPTSPTQHVYSSADYSLFAGDTMTVLIVVICATAIALVGAFLGRKAGNWKVWGIIVLVAGFVACLALRILFYQLGYAAFPFYVSTLAL